MQIEQLMNSHFPSFNESKYFFEGTEKLLEIWFESSRGDRDASLRTIKRNDLDLLLENVNCLILNSISSPVMDSYLLSESSLFVSQDRIIIKTCGKITLLRVVLPLLEVAKQKCGFDRVKDIFYSHKNFLRPELQPETYWSFEREVNILNDVFIDGEARVYGNISKDCWYVYTTKAKGVDSPDQTLEVMMMDLDREVMAMFTQSYGLTAQQLTKKTGISNILPDAVIDDWLFNPCGYSMNGLLANGVYCTIHVTTEEDFSYASFETNAPMESYTDVINKVVNIFGPRKFLVTLLANQDSAAHGYSLKEEDISDCFHCEEHKLSLLKNYSLNYALYVRPEPSVKEPYK